MQRALYFWYQHLALMPVIRLICLPNKLTRNTHQLPSVALKHSSLSIRLLKQLLREVLGSFSRMFTWHLSGLQNWKRRSTNFSSTATLDSSLRWKSIPKCQQPCFALPMYSFSNHQAVSKRLLCVLTHQQSLSNALTNNLSRELVCTSSFPGSTLLFKSAFVILLLAGQRCMSSTRVINVVQLIVSMNGLKQWAKTVLTLTQKRFHGMLFAHLSVKVCLEVRSITSSITRSSSPW